MVALITQEQFKELKSGSKIGTPKKREFVVIVANCGGPGKYPTHHVASQVNSMMEDYYIFHDGENIRFKDTVVPENDGAIVGELNN